MAQAQFGMIGLGVMGENLALNIEEHGFPVAVWNLEGEWVDRFIAKNPGKLLLFDLAGIETNPEQLLLGNVTVSSLSETLDHTAIWVGTELGDVLKITKEDAGFTVNSMNSYFPAFSKARIKILTITETTQDLVWVGTDGDGVYKFLTRPKTFYSILSGPPENGRLSHNIIRSIYEDESGTLYVGTRGGGLNIITPNSDRTKIINSRNGLSNDAVLSLNKDHHGNIWVGLDGEGKRGHRSEASSPGQRAPRRDSRRVAGTAPTIA